MIEDSEETVLVTLRTNLKNLSELVSKLKFMNREISYLLKVV